MSRVSAAVIEELRAVVGGAHVRTEPAELAPHSRDTGPWRTVGAALVEPATTLEVAAVLRVANRERLPVWTFSGGWNWGYGAAMGLDDGALILHLRRMDRVLEVNRELAYAVVEPGVTQQQLRDHLDVHAPDLWSDCTDSTPRGSVLGNALEHGVGYGPDCDHFGALCGLEVVLADGTVVRTGGGPPGSTTWHLHRWGTGPSLDGLFGQSNLGVVTRAGVHLTPRPEAFRLVLLELDRDDDLGDVIDVVRDLTLRGILRANFHTVNDVLFAAVLGPYPRDLLAPGATRLTDDGLRALRARLQITPASLTLGLSGTRGQVAEQRALLQQRLARFGKISVVGPTLAARLPGLATLLERAGATLGERAGARLAGLTGLTPAKLRTTANVYRLLQGIPGERVLGFAYFKARGARPERDVDPARDGAGMIWAPVILPLTGAHVRAVAALARPVFHRHGFDYANTFISISGRATMSLMPIFFDRDDADETARAQALQQELFALTQAAGYPQYRTGHGLHRVMFDDAPGYRAAARAIKRALDPNGILAPGRYGLDTEG
ncbi:MAG: FAD-binding oxidoreductase [Myxococcales bacterium]|nr:FAD-binding oxidoreductase [Myxococcales bacterium]